MKVNPIKINNDVHKAGEFVEKYIYQLITVISELDIKITASSFSDEELRMVI